MHTGRQLVRSHPRLMIALVAGVAIGIILPQSWNVITRILAGWNAAVWSYLILMAWLMTRASHARVREMAEQEDNNGLLVLATLSIAATLSLAAIVLELASAKNLSGSVRTFHYVFTGATVLGSWLLVATIYTFHYANLFYRSPPEKRVLRFPEEEQNPDYWDFLYVSFTIAVAAQTSDVCIMSRAMRKAVTAQSILSFLFNAAIIGMSINIAAGLLGS
jgi:uncharacterized membrane protein